MPNPLQANRVKPVLLASVLAGLVACAPVGPESTVAPAPRLPEASSVPSATTAAPAELQSALAAYAAAWTRRDADAIAAFYTDQTHGTAGDAAYHGRQQIAAQWLAPNLPGMSEMQITNEAITGSGSQYTVTGRYSFRAGGNPTAGTFTHDWARQPDGSWKVVAFAVH